MKKSVVPPIDFQGESNLHSPEPSQPSVPKGDTSCLQHFYNICTCITYMLTTILQIVVGLGVEEMRCDR